MRSFLQNTSHFYPLLNPIALTALTTQIDKLHFSYQPFGYGNALWSEFFSWNNLSVKHKLFGLVLLPIILLFFLAGQHVHNLSTQAQDLQKAQLFSVYIDKVSYLFNLPNNPSISNKADKTAQLIQELKETTPRVWRQF